MVVMMNELCTWGMLDDCELSERDLHKALATDTELNLGFDVAENEGNTTGVYRKQFRSGSQGEKTTTSAFYSAALKKRPPAKSKSHQQRKTRHSKGGMKALTPLQR